MKLPFVIQLPKETRSNLEGVAAAGHMDATKYAAVWLQELSTLRPEYALKVLGVIPPEWKKRGPGRPPARASEAGTVAASISPELTSQDVG